MKSKNWLARRRSSVEVSEEDGVRSLHLGGDAIQSSIRLDRPDELALDYTRAMMAFLLFQPLPREVLMIGLGGGSMARYIHQRMPGDAHHRGRDQRQGAGGGAQHVPLSPR